MIFKCYQVNGGDSWEIHLCAQDEYFGTEDTVMICAGSSWERAFVHAEKAIKKLGPALKAKRIEHAKLMAKIAKKKAKP